MMLIAIETGDPGYVWDIVQEALRAADETLEPRWLETDYSILCAAFEEIGIPAEPDPKKMYHPDRGNYAASHGDEDAVVIVGLGIRDAAFLFDSHHRFSEVR